MTAPFANPDGLRKWLEGFKPTQIVGMTVRMRDCPAAEYLKATGYLEAYVTPHGFGDYSKPRSHFGCPGWLCRFVLKIDQLGNGRPVQARTALHILAEVTA